MILNSSLGFKTYYEIIGVKEDADLEQIRKTYRSAILNFHPDKLQKASEPSDPENDFGKQFLDVQKAWEVLSDPRSRALYDNELRTSRQDAVTAEDVTLEDMAIEGDDDDDNESSFTLSYDCRCGDLFSINSCELAEMGFSFSRNGNEISLEASASVPASVVLPCGSCSLRVRLIVDVLTLSSYQS